MVTVIKDGKIEDLNYAGQVDDTSTTDVTYIGKAKIGSVTSDSLWQIKKVDESSNTTITWADSNSDFDNVWDNRTSLTYG